MKYSISLNFKYLSMKMIGKKIKFWTHWKFCANHRIFGLIKDSAGWAISLNKGIYLLSVHNLLCT